MSRLPTRLMPAFRSEVILEIFDAKYSVEDKIRLILDEWISGNQAKRSLLAGCMSILTKLIKYQRFIGGYIA